MRIGLLGGSFNPAHAGHIHIAETARKRLGLDQIWLLVSPGNVLKPRRGMASFQKRLASASVLADGRRIVATGIEAVLGVRFSIDTLLILKRRFPRAKFVWIMGADILEQLPRWRRWHAFAANVPLAVLPRGRHNLRALAGPAARRLHTARRSNRMAHALADATPPAWIFLQAPQHPASASAIRAARQGGQS